MKSKLPRELISNVDGPYHFSGKKVGEIECGGPDDPDVKILESEYVHIRAMKYHVLLIRIGDGLKRDDMRVGRLVAELENDSGEVEVARYELPVSEEDTENHINYTQCAACLMTIADGAPVVVRDAQAYHRHCWRD